MSKRRIHGFTGLQGFSLRAGLAVGFVAMIVLTLFVGFVSLLSQQRSIGAVDKLLDVDGRIAVLSASSNVAMLKARRAEKDFLLFRREFGFDEAKSRYATLLRISLAEIRQNMAEVRVLNGEPGTIEQTLAVERAVSQYEAGFLKVVELYGALGHVNTGFEGQMRETAHRIESIVNAADEARLVADLLSLRRHEKDFIARGLDKYAEAFAKGVDQVKDDLAAARLSSARKKELFDLADEYARLFEQYVQTDTRIDAQTATYVAAAHTVEPILDNLHTIARRGETATRNDVAKATQVATRAISGTGVFAVLLGLGVAWLVSRTITRAVDESLDFATRVAHGDLTTRLMPRGRNEFGTLALALNEMTEALQQRDRGLRRAQSMAKLAHVITGPDGSFESWSESLPNMIGIEPGQMPRSTREWLDVLHPDDRAMFRGKCIEAGVKGTRTAVDYRLRRADGAWVHVRQVMDPLAGEAVAQGRTRWFNTLQDITEYRAQQERIERLSRVYALLSGINGLLVRVRHKEELFREVCRVAVAAGGFRMAWVGVVDRAAGLVEPVAWLGTDENYIRSIPRGLDETEPARVSLTIRAVRERKAMIADDITADPRVILKAESLQRGLHSLAILPLVVSGDVVAVLALYAGEIGFFDEDERKLLNELADDLSFGLDSIEKAEQLEQATERIRRMNRTYAVISGINAAIVRIRDRDQLFGEACRIAGETGQFGAVWIGLIDRAEMVVKPVAWRGPEEATRRLAELRFALAGDAPAEQSLLAEMVRTRQAVISNDVLSDPRTRFKQEMAQLGFRSAAFLPLLIGNEVIAAFGLYAQVSGFFDASETRLLIELAGDLSFAMEHIANEEKLNYLTLYDSLTGLANRVLFLERLNQSIHAVRQSGRKLAIVLADIERLRTINESLGRQAGDAVLAQAAERLGRVANAQYVARISADHFAVLLPEVKGRSEIVRAIANLSRECLGTSFRIDGTEVKISAKAGIALFPSDGNDAETLLRNAEAALRNAKESGERYAFHTRALTEHATERLTLEMRLRQALEKDEFVLHYQPKVELETRRIVGAEALIRWQNPELGLVPPGEFIPLMEESGLILEVGAWALSRAVADHRRWLEQGLAAPRVAVNVSAIQLRKADFIASVENAIKHGATLPGIDLEITESLVMEDVESSIQKLKAVRGLGVNIAIDDFGTGYSSLGYLARLPVHSLKIDRSFIITMLDDPNTLTLVRTIISLAQSLKLKVVAEGVDSEEQARFLRLLRCDEMQGYLFSRPVPFDEMTAMLMREQGASHGACAPGPS